jgi:hypothetical protein
MTIETAVSDLTTSTTALVTAVGVQQATLDEAILSFYEVTDRVTSGLNNVNNTSDTSKPISTLTQTALNGKQGTLVSGTNISTINGQSLLSGNPLVIVRSATSLNQVNYEDRATLRSLSPEIDDSIVLSGVGFFMWVDSQDEPDDDETCFTTATGQWLLQAPSWDLIDAWNLIEKSYVDDFIEDESNRFAAFLANK